MENRTSYQKELFCNRLKKKYKELRKWARKNRITCYRLYDRDIPEVPVSLDVYEFLPEYVTNTLECTKFMQEQNARIAQNDLTAEEEASKRRYAVLYLYERPYEKDKEEEKEWLLEMAEGAATVLGISKDRIIQKERKIQKGANQYEKENLVQKEISGFVQEQGQIFKITLTSYLDTGLFFDHRMLRAHIRNISSKKRILNLFCYTASFSVYAAQGNAKYIESIDLSNTYISIAKENFEKNGFLDSSRYVFTKADVISWLYEKVKTIKDEEKFDIIILDPPTFSNSKSTANVLDINKDWPKMTEQCLKLLKPKGILYFSTNSTRLSFDKTLLPKNAVYEDCTANSIPKDFEGTKCHRLWKIYNEE